MTPRALAVDARIAAGDLPPALPRASASPPLARASPPASATPAPQPSLHHLPDYVPAASACCRPAPTVASPPASSRTAAPLHRFAAQRRRIHDFLIVSAHRPVVKHHRISQISSPPSSQTADLRFSAVLIRRRAAPPLHSISAVVAPPTTPRRLQHLLDQVNLPDPFASAADAPPPLPSSASPPRINRPRRRRTRHGGATATHRSIRLVEAEVTVPSRGAAVTGIAGDASAGGGRLKSRARAQTRPDNA
jgi:hypothetical protein